MDQGLHQLAPVFRRDLRVVQRIDGGGGRVAPGRLLRRGRGGFGQSGGFADDLDDDVPF